MLEVHAKHPETKKQILKEEKSDIVGGKGQGNQKANYNCLIHYSK